MTSLSRAGVLDYAGSHSFPLSRAELWGQISQLECYPLWWAWLADFRAQPSELDTGTVFTGAVRPPLPYQLRLHVQITRCEPERSIEAAVTGDLAGVGRLRLVDDGPADVRVDLGWTLELRQPAMRAALRVARPALRWGHDWVVARAVTGFRSGLRDAPAGER